MGGEICASGGRPSDTTPEEHDAHDLAGDYSQALLGLSGGSMAPFLETINMRAFPLWQIPVGAGTSPDATEWRNWAPYTQPYGMVGDYTSAFSASSPSPGAFASPMSVLQPSSSSQEFWPTQTTMQSEPLQVPQPSMGRIPPFGNLHSFHPETRDMGEASADMRCFTKVGYEGRLSVVSESRVHNGGVQRYLVQFKSGELSRADGVGFIFSTRLPCPKNIQRIVSIFVNQRGRVCMRVFAEIARASAYVKPLELGDWVEMIVDLENRVASFNIWQLPSNSWPPHPGIEPVSSTEFRFGDKLGKMNQTGAKAVKLHVGHLACVVKNVGVTVVIGS